MLNGPSKILSSLILSEKHDFGNKNYLRPLVDPLARVGQNLKIRIFVFTKSYRIDLKIESDFQNAILVLKYRLSAFDRAIELQFWTTSHHISVWSDFMIIWVNFRAKIWHFSAKIVEFFFFNLHLILTKSVTGNNVVMFILRYKHQKSSKF